MDSTEQTVSTSADGQVPPPPVTPLQVPIVPLVVGLALIFAWRVFFTLHANLIPDECSYWAWSRRLDWSYFDNAGMVAYLIRLSTTLFGESTPFSVRLPFLVLSGLTTYLLYRTSVVLFEDKARGLLVAVLFNLTPMALLGGSAAVHDNALIFFWTLTLWAAARFVKSERPMWFFVMGLTSGLALLSKYTGALAPLSLLVFLGWMQRFRPWLKRKEPWIGAVIAAAFAAPIVWWNATHEWASVHHIFYIGSGGATLGRRFLDGLGYHLAQFLVISPFLYIALLTSCGLAALRNVFKPKPEQALLLCFGLPLALFGIQAFRGHVEANWATMGYVSTGILAVEVIFLQRASARPGICARFDARFLKWGIALAVLPVVLVVLHAWIGLLPAAVERKIAKEDRIIWETNDWEGLGLHVAALKKPGDVIAADSYQLCALLEFNVPGNPAVRYLAPWKRPTQFDVWEPSFDNIKGRDILYVSPQPLEPTSAARLSIFENFRSVEALQPYTFMYHGEPIRQVYISRGKFFDPLHPRKLGPRSLLYKE